MVSVEQINPLADPRWQEFLSQHPDASVFHTPEWLRCLQRTYGYEPVVFTCSRPGETLRDGMVFCAVKSWFARPRLVSLPFSDHADPLVSDYQNVGEVLAAVAGRAADGNWSSIELRPREHLNSAIEPAEFTDGQRFVLHTLDLQPSPDQLFRALNKDCTRRKILKAEKQGLRYDEGRSERHLEDFFQLCVMTRRRKGLPPPPLNWFRNLVQCLGEKLKIRIARTPNGELAGTIVTLHFKQTVVFKYGASDSRFHNLGTMPFLLWRAIEDAKSAGATAFDFGRSEIENPGLLRFKDHFAAKRSWLVYKVFPSSAWEPGAAGWQMKFAKKIFAQLPDSALILAGRLIYPHIG